MAAQRPKLTARQVFAENLRQRRKAAGFSQDAFAHACGLHRTYIGQVERAEKNISIDSMERIANALKCPLPSLLVMIR